MVRARSIAFALLLPGCAAPTSELPAEPGHVTGACIDDTCFPGAVCLSELCVDPSDGGSDPSDDDDDADADAEAEASDAGDAPPSSSEDGSGDASGATTSIGDDGSDSDPRPTDDEGNDTAADGTSCTDDDECRSGHCFVLGILGGVCGECELDEDCAGGGCSLPDPFAEPPAGSTCNDGGSGDGCMSDAVCAGELVCVQLFVLEGVLTTSTCGECHDDGDCSGGTLCAPDLDPATFGGATHCVAPGSLANGHTCDFTGSGDASCDSGHCAVANVMNLLELGVCSECEDDGDCGGGACVPATVQDGSIVPATCG